MRVKAARLNKPALCVISSNLFAWDPSTLASPRPQVMGLGFRV